MPYSLKSILPKYQTFSMVRDLERVQKSSKFPESAPAGEAVFYRTYSRRQSTGRESWQQVGDRILEGLVSLGKLTPSQAALTAKMQQQLGWTPPAGFTLPDLKWGILPDGHPLGEPSPIFPKVLPPAE